MASHRRPKPPTRTRVSVLTALATAAVALSSQSAMAAPDKPNKDEVKTKVDALYEESEQAGEKANAAKDRQDKLEKEIAQLQDAVARGQDELNSLRNTLGSMATAQYRGGGLDQSVELLLSADPQTYLDKASTLQQLSGKQVEAISKIQAKQRALAQQRQEATGKLADLDAVRKELAEKKKASQDKLAAAQAQLNSLTAEERSQLKSEAAKDGADAAKAAGGGSKPGAPKGSGRAAAALAAAVTQEGKGYNMGSTGMAYWDCSSLAQWAYAQAGCPDQPHHLHADQRRHAHRHERAPARGPGLLLRRPAPRRPLRGQRPGLPRRQPQERRQVRGHAEHALPVRRPRRLTPPRPPRGRAVHRPSGRIARTRPDPTPRR